MGTRHKHGCLMSAHFRCVCSTGMPSRDSLWQNEPLPHNQVKTLYGATAHSHHTAACKAFQSGNQPIRAWSG